jgi:aminoglycoside phosphotransferase (APT) family kinase protein
MILISATSFSATHEQVHTMKDSTRAASKRTIESKLPPGKKFAGHRIAKRRNPKILTRSRKQISKSKPKPTGRPSDGWISWDGVRDGAHTNKIRDVFKTGDWRYLRREAVKSHQRRAYVQGKPVDSGLTCEIKRTRFASGASNVVLEVAFSDLTYWIVRIRLPEVAEEDQEVEREMQSEIATMRLIQQRTSVPVATIFGYNSEQDNQFGYRYMFMSPLPGRHLDQPFAISVPPQHWAKVAAQLADVLHQISTKMTFERIGRIWCGKDGEEEPSIISFNAYGASDGKLGHFPIGPFSTSVDYFYTLRQSENAAIQAAVQARLHEILGKDADIDWLIACQIFEHALCSLVLQGKKAGPFPLKHPDFHFNNILLDDDFNITGILDWTGAQTVPCESFAIGVEFITPPTMSKEAPIRRFRDLVKRAWEEKELGRHHSKSTWSMSDIIGSSRGDLIYFSYTFGALRRAVAYARIVVPLLYGSGFTLESFRRNVGVGG